MVYGPPQAFAPRAALIMSTAHSRPTLVVDLDGTLTVEGSADRYEDVMPRPEVIEQLRNYAAQGFRVAIMTSRNMRSFDNSVGRINAFTLPVVIEWLKRHDVPFDEIHVGKPWCGPGGFYVDDKAIRPSEFRTLSRADIALLLEKERG
jgi:capsule biosynthesis phosphatase